MGPLNVCKQCEYYNVPLRRCPQFLFLMMGVFIAATIITTDAVARRYLSPEAVALIVLALTAVLFVISHIVISSFEMVARASRAKSDFISIMSHRLRSPLSSVKWRLELLADRVEEAAPEETREFLEDIREQNEKMIGIINDLIELSNIEDDKLVLNKSAFSLAEAVREAMEEKEEASREAGVPIVMSAPEGLGDVFGDREKTKGVVARLLDNAIRYSLKGNKVSVALENMPGGARCSVTDEGAGILESERKKIFNKFFRGRGKTRYQTEGTGIGLFIAKETIERSGGKMGFISIAGKGSTFWFTLPAAKK